MKFWLLAVLFIPLFSLAASYPDAERFRPAIESFTSVDRNVGKGGVVATGSSSMKDWHDRITTDLAPLSLIPRASAAVICTMFVTSWRNWCCGMNLGL